MRTAVAYSDPRWTAFPFVEVVRHAGRLGASVWTVHDRDTMETAPPSRGLHLCAATSYGMACFPGAAYIMRRLSPMLTRFGLPTNEPLTMSEDDVDFRVMALCGTCGLELANAVRISYGRPTLCPPDTRPVD